MWWVAVACLASVTVVVGTVVAEVVMAMMPHTAPIRPSQQFAWVAQRCYDGLWNAGYLAGLFADVFGFGRRAMLWVRNMFFAWIPVEIIEQAVIDLSRPLWTVAKLPFAAIAGLYSSLRASRHPIVAACAFVLGSVVVPVMAEMLLLAFPRVNLPRPSHVLLKTGSAAYNAVFQVSYVGVMLFDVGHLGHRVALWMRETLLPWIPMETAVKAVNDLHRAVWQWLLVWRGVREGGALSLAEAYSRTTTIVLGSIALASVVLSLAGLGAWYCYGRQRVGANDPLTTLLQAAPAVHSGSSTGRVLLDEDDHEEEELDEAGSDSGGEDTQPHRRPSALSRRPTSATRSSSRLRNTTATA